MRHISKNAQPETFANWKAQGNENWQPTYRDLQNPQKRDVHRALLAEQGHTCCYCGRSITLENSHIEHFQPQHTHAVRDLDYENLHASCIREANPGSPLHCGHAKNNDYHAARIIAPLEAACEVRFSYVPANGKIIPNDITDANAEYMIDLLKLNTALIANGREAALASVFDTQFISTASDSELAQLARAFRQRDDNHSLMGFFHVLARYAEQLIARPVKQGA